MMQRNTLKEQAYAIMKARIIDCTYPPESFLVESELMEQVGASRTPIREALNKLEQENLVRILPKRGVMVTGITMTALDEVYEVRQMVEPYIIEHYGHLLEKEKLTEQIAQIQNSAALPTGTQFHAVDDDLHKMLLMVSNNTHLQRMMDTIYAENSRIRVFSGLKVETRRAQTLVEHTEILQHLLAGDVAKASHAMQKHLANSKKTAVDALRATGTR